MGGALLIPPLTFAQVLAATSDSIVLGSQLDDVDLYRPIIDMYLSAIETSLTPAHDLLWRTWLNGTPRSAAYSRGSPSTRSPMTLRAISSLPPPSATVWRDR